MIQFPQPPPPDPDACEACGLSTVICGYWHIGQKEVVICWHCLLVMVGDLHDMMDGLFLQGGEEMPPEPEGPPPGDVPPAS